MKITEVTEVQTIKVVKKTYACDSEGCSFTTESEYAAKSHYGKEHACAEERHVAGVTVRRFTTKEDAEAYASEHAEDRTDVSWDGPGWYVQSYDRRPCPRGCCKDSYLCLESVSSMIYEIKDKIREQSQKLKGLRALEKNP